MSTSDIMQNRNILFTMPRSASNLLMRILNVEEQPQFLFGGTGGGYFFLQMEMDRIKKGLSTDVRTWSEEDTTAMRKIKQSCMEAMARHIDAAEEQGKNVYIKEHTNMIVDPVSVSEAFYEEESSHGPRFTAEDCGKSYKGGLVTPLNVSMFSDAFLKTLRPTFLIRHPALMYPSLFRTLRDLDSDTSEFVTTKKKKYCTLLWSRSLYDWFVKNRTDEDSMFPIILDADDIVSQPTYLLEYSKLVGLDPPKLKFEWKEKSEDDLEGVTPHIRRMTNTLNASSGILQNQGMSVAGLDIDQEIQKWKEEFGEEAAESLARDVWASIDDYEYMRARRFRPQ